jgi:hypothetical protein
MDETNEAPQSESSGLNASPRTRTEQSCKKFINPGLCDCKDTAYAEAQARIEVLCRFVSKGG